MATRYLGDHFDFHGGGRDLLFPHHENELAQSCCATGGHYVNHWLHNGLLYLGRSKMSKSDGNFLAMDTLLEQHPAAALRFYLLNAHFRSQLDFSQERLAESGAAYDRLRRGSARLIQAAAQIGQEGSDQEEHAVPTGLVSIPGGRLGHAVEARRAGFFACMDDDFNSGGAIGELFGLVRDVNLYLADTGDRVFDPGPITAAAALIREADQILGLFPDGLDPAAGDPDAVPAAVQALIDERDEARRARDFARADRLRDRIQTMGWEVMDTPHGSTVRPLGVEA
jgi:cysteinyl-tRNA synthetase